MRFGVLGPVVALDEGRSLPLGGPRQRAVLAMLLADPGRPLSIDRLIAEAWGDEAKSGAVASLYTYVSNLRRLLGKDRIVRDPVGYRLVMRADDELDLTLFEVELGDARKLNLIDPGAVAASLGTAMERWRGRPFEGAEDTPLLNAEAARLSEIRGAVEVERFEAILRSGAVPEVAEVEQLCQRRPLDERAWGALMQTLYRSGRHPDALRTFARAKRFFAEEMGIEPSPALKRLEEQILLHDSVLEASVPTGLTNLPVYATTFIGRAEEQRRLVDALSTHRLVTILGPGGVGKTRLAVEVTSSLTGSFSDGIWLVDLARVTDPAQVVPIVARTLGAARTESDELGGLVAWLQARTLLLVLDNCEHLVSPVGRLVSGLLEGTHTVKILATSRQALGEQGEVRFQLAGLTAGWSVDADSSPGEADRLFLERALLVDGGLGRTDTDRASVSSICRRLDGIPLALELAAARAAALTPGEINDLLTRRFAVLVDEHQKRDIHRSLEATVGWSYGLLKPADRAAFELLGVFEGPFTRPAAAAVLGVEVVGAVEVIERLASASLLTVEYHSEQRTTYRLLETLRAYARDRLIELDRWSEAVRRHDSYYLFVSDRLRNELYGAGRVAATLEVSAELAEYMAAWDRSIETDPGSVLGMAWPLGNTWLFDRDLGEGAARLPRLIELTQGDRSLDRARALVIAGWIVVFRNRIDDSIAWTTEAVRMFRRAGDDMGLAYALARAGHWAFASGASGEAMSLLNESVEICDRIGYEEGKAWPIVLIAQARRWSGDSDPEVRAMFLDARRRFVEIGEPYGQIHADMILSSFDEFSVEERIGFGREMVEIALARQGQGISRSIAFHCLAYATWDLGEVERAEGLNMLAIRSALSEGLMMNLGLSLFQAAVFASRQGLSERSAMMFGAGETHFGMMVAPFQQVMFDAAADRARADLGEDRYRELFRIGSALTPEEAARYASEEAAMFPTVTPAASATAAR